MEYIRFGSTVIKKAKIIDITISKDVDKLYVMTVKYAFISYVNNDLRTHITLEERCKTTKEVMDKLYEIANGRFNYPLYINNEVIELVDLLDKMRNNWVKVIYKI